MPIRTRVTISLPSELVRRMDRQSRAQGASRSGVAERWLRAGERQASLSSLEQDIESYYSHAVERDEAALGASLGRAAREIASDRVRRRRRPRGRSSS
jgi:metal-responsive CopG/Arc/MetJ family transcriptional regulator